MTSIIGRRLQLSANDVARAYRTKAAVNVNATALLGKIPSALPPTLASQRPSTTICATACFLLSCPRRTRASRCCVRRAKQWKVKPRLQLFVTVVWLRLYFPIWFAAFFLQAAAEVRVQDFEALPALARALNELPYAKGGIPTAEEIKKIARSAASRCRRRWTACTCQFRAAKRSRQ